MAELTQEQIIEKQKAIVVAQQVIADNQYALQTDANTKRLAQLNSVKEVK